MLCLTSCKMANISNACPPIVNYTLEEQKELNRIRKELKEKKEADLILLDRFLIDYFNLREDLALCHAQ